jgi:hypothetical protein
LAEDAVTRYYWSISPYYSVHATSAVASFLYRFA